MPFERLIVKFSLPTSLPPVPFDQHYHVIQLMYQE